jgi:Tfp pilus assembly protein PilN
LSGERDFSTRRRARGSRPGDIALLTLGAVALAWSVYSAGSAWADLRRARTSLDSVRQEIAAAEARIKALQSAAAGEGALGARAVWSVEAPPPRVVQALAEMLPPEVRLETVVLRYGAQLDVEMTLTARSAAEYDLFLRALESSPSFDRVVLGEETRTDAVRASVRARYHAGEES